MPRGSRSSAPWVRATSSTRHGCGLRVSDITETSVCPLARVMRRELRKRGIERLKVVWSPEEPIAPEPPKGEAPPEGRRAIPGSTAFVPAAAGLLMASEIVRDLIGKER